jgi:hypothetical protein
MWLRALVVVFIGCGYGPSRVYDIVCTDRAALALTAGHHGSVLMTTTTRQDLHWSLVAIDLQSGSRTVRDLGDHRHYSHVTLDRVGDVAWLDVAGTWELVAMRDGATLAREGDIIARNPELGGTIVGEGFEGGGLRVRATDGKWYVVDEKTLAVTRAGEPGPWTALCRSNNVVTWSDGTTWGIAEDHDGVAHFADVHDSAHANPLALFGVGSGPILSAEDASGECAALRLAGPESVLIVHERSLVDPTPVVSRVAHSGTLWTRPVDLVFGEAPEHLWLDASGRVVYVQTQRTIAAYDRSTLERRRAWRIAED